MVRRSLSGRMTRMLMVCGLAVALLSTMRMATASPIHDPGCGSLRVCIANEARYEFSNDDGHKFEHPAGSNCNFFSTQWHADAPKCDNGMYAEAWCMDFVHWVYKQEGASVSGLGSLPHLASSAKVYGQNHNTWHPNTPHVGDMALWNTNEPARWPRKRGRGRRGRRDGPRCRCRSRSANHQPLTAGSASNFRTADCPSGESRSADAPADV
jgi:hypothetical protein